MPTWSEILDELNKSSDPKRFDKIRREYLLKAHQHTGRNVILYASRFTQPVPGIPPEATAIGDGDLSGIMEVVHGLTGSDLDLILHSPGGSLTAAEALVLYLRSKFKNIRVIVPQLAMSAATMIACAADKIVLGKHSFLGPIDPQIVIDTPLGQRMVPAQAIIDQFSQAQSECQDPKKLAAWLPMLSQYGPDLLVQCQHASELSEALVRTWLEQYMYSQLKTGARKAAAIAKWLSDHSIFKTHGRHIPRSDLRKHGLYIEDLEKDQQQQDLFLSVFHATTHTFTATPAAKIIENHLGKSHISMVQVVSVRQQQGNPPVTENLPEQ